jgi:hypothetical protein
MVRKSLDLIIVSYPKERFWMSALKIIVIYLIFIYYFEKLKMMT